MVPTKQVNWPQKVGLHGDPNLNKYTEQQKLDAVETYRSGELGLKKTAALHGVDVASLRKWVAATA